jgi:serine/threonine protein kinase
MSGKDRFLEEAEQALEEQRNRWKIGDFVSVEALVRENPGLGSSKPALMELVYGEIVLREENKEKPKVEEYVERFPQISEAIVRQFQVHHSLEEDYGNSLSTVPEGFAALQTKTSAAPAREVEGFLIKDVIGNGACGVVYEAVDLNLNRAVAIKFLHPSLVSIQSRVDLFQRESRAAAKLDHPGIVRVFQVNATSTEPWIAMELIRGGSLFEKLRSGPLEAKSAAKIAYKVTDAIDHAHQNGVIHRDIKAANVFLDGEGEGARVCVGDFGLARQTDIENSIHATGEVIGTPAYMSPEQARGKKADERSDVYSIGALLYEMLCGKPPFQSPTAWEVIHDVITNDPVPPRQLIASTPRDLETICLKCLEKRPERRYQSAADLADELQRYLEGKPIKARPVGLPMRFWKSFRRNPVVSLLTVAVALALIGTAVTALVSRNSVMNSLNETAIALDESEKQRTIAVDAMTEMIFEVYNELEKHKSSLAARKGVLEHAIKGLEEIVDTAGHRNDTRRALSSGYDRLAHIHSISGQFDIGKELSDKGIAIAESMTNRGHENGYAAEEQIVRTKLNLCRMYTRSAQAQKAIDLSQDVVEMIDGLLEQDPDHGTLLYLKLNALERDTVFSFTAESIVVGEEARTLGESLLGRDDVVEEGVVQCLREVTSSLGARYLTSGQLRLAKERFMESVKYAEAHLEESPDSPALIADHCYSMVQVSRLQMMEMQYDDAQKNVDAAIEDLQNVIGTDSNPSVLLKYSGALDVKARCLYAQGDLAAVSELIDRHIETVEKVIAAGPDYGVQYAAISQARLFKSDVVLAEGGEIEAACEEVAKAIEALGSVPENFAVPQQIALYQQLHDMALAIKDPESIGDDAELLAMRFHFDAWQDALHGQCSIVEEKESELVSAMSDVKSPLGKILTASFQSRTYAKWYEKLISENADADVVESVKLKALASIAAYGGSTNQPFIHATDPDFMAIRETEELKAKSVLP